MPKAFEINCRLGSLSVEPAITDQKYLEKNEFTGQLYNHSTLELRQEDYNFEATTPRPTFRAFDGIFWV